MRLVGIRETFFRAIAKLIMMAVGDQEKTACGSIQICACIESSIEGATHAVAQRQRVRHMLEPGGGADAGSEGSEDKSAEATSGADRAGEAARVGSIG